VHIEALEKRTISESNLHNYLNSLDFSGGIMLAPEDLRSENDKKNNFQPILFLSQDKSTIYYSSYGANENNGKDLYSIKKLPSGGWAPPENLGDVINTQYDENYPVISNNGKTMYFSSKGHNSMGGYDIFSSTWDSKYNKWSAPKNMGAPINSPYNDFYFIY